MFGPHPFLVGAPGLEQQQVSVPTLSRELRELKEVNIVVHCVERSFDCSTMTYADTEVTEQTKSLEIMRKFAEQYAKRSDTM
jgi:DNA-binding HxlR family transcriptional regulator